MIVYGGFHPDRRYDIPKGDENHAEGPRIITKGSVTHQGSVICPTGSQSHSVHYSSAGARLPGTGFL